MEEVKRDRARRKLLRVTFPNGKVLCYKSTTDTMIATMQELGDDVIANIKLQSCHLPLLSKEIYPRYKEWMKPVCNGWYLNTQSNSDTKFLQLNAINEQLSLGLKIELGEDFIAQDNPNKEKRTRTKGEILVKLRRTRQTLWSAVQMLTQKLCCQTIHDCPKVVPLHYESE